MTPTAEATNSPPLLARPVRVLFVSLWELGWKTWTQQLEHYSQGRADLEATHVCLSLPRWKWAVSRRLPAPINRPVVSAKWLWEGHIKRTVLSTLSREKFDVVFVSSQIMAPALAEECHRAGIKFAVAMDVTGPAYQRDLMNRKVSPRQQWPTERRIYSMTDLCVPMSSWIADSLQKDFQVPAARILVSPPGIATQIFRDQSPPARMNSLPRILFCGNDWKRKGGPRLLRWHQELWSEKAELHIASGSAPDVSNLPNVVFHGVVPHEQFLGELLPSSDVFCLPTLNDMSPFAVTSAQAAGLATVSSRVGGLSDLVLDGKTGYLLDRHDDAGFKAAVERLLDDSALRVNMGQAASRHAQEYLDADVIFPRLIDRLVALKTH